MRCALSIAGSDSIGGAGIQADLKAMASVGVHGHSVITALTAQNTSAVDRIMPVPTDMIADQIASVLSDSDVRGIKTGMLYSAEIVETVADALDDVNVPIVVDPVMVAGVGDSLASDDLVKALKRELIPICDVITPNRHEAEMLTNMRINNEDDARRACELLGKEGTTVYLKGGHMDSRNVVDTLYNGAEFIRFEYPRLERAGHGGGCTLSAYIAAHIAKGLDVINSIIRSREIIQDAIATMYVIGKGDKVVNPMAGMMADSERSMVLDQVNEAADRLVRMIPREWIPSGGVNLGFATESPKGPQDIAAIEGKIFFSNGSIKRKGPARFGSSETMSRLIMLIMEHDRTQKAALNITCSKDLTSIMEEVGLNTVFVQSQGNIAQATSQSIKRNGSVPDAIIYAKRGKQNGFITMLGRDPKDILGKIGSIV